MHVPDALRKLGARAHRIESHSTTDLRSGPLADKRIARREEKTVLVFLQSGVTLDARQDAFCNEVSGWQNGVFFEQLKHQMTSSAC